MWSKLRRPLICYIGGHDRSKTSLVIFSLGILIFIGITIVQNWKNITAFPWQCKWANLGAGALTHLLALGTLFLSWHQIMRRLGGSDNWRKDFEVYSLSVLARRIPTPVWYVGGRLYLYREYKVSSAIVLSATALEIVLIALSGVACYLLLLPLYKHISAQILPWEIGYVCLLILISVLGFNPNFLIDISNRALRLLGRPQMSASVTRMDLTIWEAIYLGTWLLDGLSLYLIVSAFVPKSLPVPDIVGVSTISALVGLATLALPAGFWLKELTISALLSTWMPLSVGIVVAICYRLTHILLEILWALAGFWIGRSLRTEQTTVVQKEY